MPLYDFRCHTCGEFEAWQALAELDQPLPCPTCQSTAKRLLSPPNLNLNSSGFNLRRSEAKEPELVKRDREPKPTRNKATHGRPWMISH